MTVALTFATALAAGWIIDRLAFHGELSGMIRDEIAAVGSRRRQSSKASRPRRSGDAR